MAKINVLDKEITVYSDFKPVEFDGFRKPAAGNRV